MINQVVQPHLKGDAAHLKVGEPVGTMSGSRTDEKIVFIMSWLAVVLNQ